MASTIICTPKQNKPAKEPGKNSSPSITLPIRIKQRKLAVKSRNKTPPTPPSSSPPPSSPSPSAPPSPPSPSRRRTRKSRVIPPPPPTTRLVRTCKCGTQHTAPGIAALLYALPSHTPGHIQAAKRAGRMWECALGRHCREARFYHYACHFPGLSMRWTGVMCSDRCAEAYYEK